MRKEERMALTGGAGIFLLLLLIYGCGHKWEQSRAAMAADPVIEENEEVGKKIALTFDGDVIIGLSPLCAMDWWHFYNIAPYHL